MIHPEMRRAIEWDCQQVMLRFYESYDDWQYEEMLDMCTPDAVWFRSGTELQGREMIHEAIKTRSTTQVVRHVITNMVVDVHDANTATVRFLLTAYRFDNGTKQQVAPLIDAPILLLVVNTEMVQHENRWLMARQLMKREFVFDKNI